MRKLFEESWKKFLKENSEGESLSRLIDDPRFTKFIKRTTVDDIDDGMSGVACDYFRLAFEDKRTSASFPGSRFVTFRPRTPRYPLEGEDNFTPRISWAEKIADCQTAIGGHRDVYYLFGVQKKSMPGFIQPLSTLDCWYEREEAFADAIARILSDYPEKSHDAHTFCFDMKQIDLGEDLYDKDQQTDLGATIYRVFGKTFGKQSKIYSNLIQYCVPDCAETGEVWTTEPTKAIYLGQIIFNSVYLIDWENIAVEKNTEPEQIELPLGV